MPSRFVIAQLKTAGGQALDTVVQALSKVSEYARVNEPGVLKHCGLIALEGDSTSLFAIEEYADQASFDAHMASPAVQELVQIFQSSPHLFSAAPAIYGIDPPLTLSASFTRPTAILSNHTASSVDPLVIITSSGYKTGTLSKVVPGWDALVGASYRNEEGTLLYTVLGDEAATTVRTIEAYVNKEYLDDVHVKSAAMRKNQKENEGLENGEKEVWRLKIVGGYLFKEPMDTKA